MSLLSCFYGKATTLATVTFTMDDRKKQIRERVLKFDFALAIVSVAIAGFGVLMVYSATKDSMIQQGISQYYYLERQALYVALGVGVMILVATIDYRRISSVAYVMYGGLLLALVGVYIPHIGKTALGAQRWYQLGPFQLQPSEFASIVIIVAMAYYIDSLEGPLNLKSLIQLLIMVGIPMVLIIKQPDIGTGLVVGITGASLLAVDRTPGRYLAVLAIGAVFGVYLIVHLGVLHKFQLARLTSFLNQNKNPFGANGYNLTESKIAIGSGGFWGKGLFQGTQTNLSYVPEQQTDFIFTAVGEQLGFVGSASLIAAFGFVCYRIFRAMRLAKDPLGRLIAAGIFGLFVYSVFQNAGMTVGIMPITGIPLPFMSYGGSAMLTFFAAIGLVLNISMRRSVG